MTPRRVVTGWSDHGDAIVLFDGAPPTSLDFGVAQASELWVTRSTPAETRIGSDAAAGDWQLDPPAGGSAFRLVTYAPGAEIDLHATDTLDYVVVVSGELTLLLPEEEVALRAGDVVVQQATVHGWANRAAEPCVIAAVLLSARDRESAE